MCCLLNIYDVISWLFEKDYFTEAMEIILIINMSLGLRYVFISSTAAVRLSSTALLWLAGKDKGEVGVHKIFHGASITEVGWHSYRRGRNP